ncbi:MAG: methyltransferase domain-containing protein [Nitrospinota bacterium]
MQVGWDELGPSAIRRAVQAKYGQVAARPGEQYPFPVGRSFAERLGYPAEVLAGLPGSVTDSFTGVGVPILFAALEPGEAVLDLGSGGGLDAILAARAAGPSGRVAGVDMARAMVEKARSNVEALGLENTEFVQGYAEALPFRDVQFDVVSINGILNLCPDKRPVLAEIARVLRPGGRAIIAEIVLERDLPAAEIRALEDWFR